jgi:hypothetical protein
MFVGLFYRYYKNDDEEYTKFEIQIYSTLFSTIARNTRADLWRGCRYIATLRVFCTIFGVKLLTRAQVYAMYVELGAGEQKEWSEFVKTNTRLFADEKITCECFLDEVPLDSVTPKLANAFCPTFFDQLRSVKTKTN